MSLMLVPRFASVFVTCVMKVCSSDTTDCALPAEVAAACPTDAAWAASPPALVICGAEVNGVTLVAAAAELV